MKSKPNAETETRQLERKISDFCMWGISEQAALEIVCRHTGKTPKEVRLYETEQERWYLYRNWTEPCWYAEVDNMQDLTIIDGLSYLMVVSKVTGNVITKGFMAHW